MEQNMKDLKEKLQPLSDKLDPTVAAFIDTVMENNDIETLKTITTSMSAIINSTTDRQRISRISTAVAFASIIVTLCYSATYGLILAVANIAGNTVAQFVIANDKYKALKALDNIGFPIEEFMKDIGLYQENTDDES